MATINRRKTIRACARMLEGVYADSVSNGMSKHEYHVEQLGKAIMQLRKIEKYF